MICELKDLIHLYKELQRRCELISKQQIKTALNKIIEFIYY